MNATADKVGSFVATSAALHVALFALVVLAPVLFPKRNAESWGTSALKGSTSVGVTDSLPGIPLPTASRVTDDAKPTDTKTVNPAEPAPKVAPKVPPKPADVKIPERGAATAPKTQPQPTRSANANAPERAPAAPTNAIPGNDRGQTALPTGPVVGGEKATFGGDGTFGSRFPAYVNSLVQAIEQEWGKSVPPGANVRQRAYVTFTIIRNGRDAVATNVDIAQPSGNSQFDSLARRTVASTKLPPLPPDYKGSSVDVRFYFDYTR